MDPQRTRLPGLLALSGAAALLCELVWLRRLTLAFGSSGLALTLTLAVYMGGLGIGGLLAGRRSWRRAPAGYGLLELGAASWALAMPWVLQAVLPVADAVPGVPGAALAAALALGPPAVLHGATLPAAASALDSGRGAGLLYASNTAGAVVGTLLAPLLLLPGLGVRGTELSAAALGATAGLLALHLACDRARLASLSPAASPAAPAPEARPAGKAAGPAAGLPAGLLVAGGLAGAVSLSLEVAWSRLGTLLLGGSIYAVATVLAMFLLGTAAGATLGRRWGPRAVAPALVALGLLAASGTVAWRVLPHALGLSWSLVGDSGLGLAGALLVALAMGGAPVASGVVFTGALAAAPGAPGRAAGNLLGANTLGSVLGSALTGLYGLPLLGIRGVVSLAAVLCVVGGLALLPSPRRPRSVLLPLLGLSGLLLLAPRWDPALYSVGLYLRVADFADLSPRAVERFAHEGFRLLSYADGRTATVAVGESTTTGNRWLAINGKVDASTGDDMPTQILSGELPVQIFRARAGRAPNALVVGLASGITVRATHEAGAAQVTVVELEPEVVVAAERFSRWNHDLLHTPGVRVVTADARSWLRQLPADQGRFDIVISEPSNPWITGVSNLFTREYWQLVRAHLGPDGVVCQWVQLYALPPEALRGLLRTFVEVFPDASLYETIEGSDALLITGPPPPGLALAPTLSPEALRRLAGVAPRNTDDHPWVELEAPRWLHRPTGALNAALIARAAGEPSGR